MLLERLFACKAALFCPPLDSSQGFGQETSISGGTALLKYELLWKTP